MMVDSSFWRAVGCQEWKHLAGASICLVGARNSRLHFVGCLDAGTGNSPAVAWIRS